MTRSSNVQLSEVPGWAREYVERLGAQWITTADQVVAAAATPTGLEALARQLGVSVSEMRALTQSAKSVLAEDVVEKLSQPVDTSQYGLGARRPLPEND